MGQPLDLPVSFITIECCNCHVAFAMPQWLYSSFRSDSSKYFFCPSGHKQHFAGESDEQRLTRELEQAKAKAQREEESRRTAQREAESARRTAKRERTIRKRLEQRSRGGLCPCCRRSFSQLRDHMAEKHPGYGHPLVAVGGGA